MKKLNKHREKAKLCLLLLVALFSKQDGFTQTVKNELKKAAPEKIKPKPNLKPLKIGDHLPDIEFNKMINYRTRTLKLSEFKGKWVILDFWATTCVPCIKKFPKMDSLQKQFKGQLQVILVNSKSTRDNEKKILASFQRQERINGIKIKLPCAVEDTIADILFPHKMVPHYAWIDGKGILRHVTESEFVTAENIQAGLAGKNLRLPEKKDFIEFDFGKPLFIDNNGGNGENIIYRSVLTGYTEGLPGALGVNCDAIGQCTKIYATNVSILSLYRHAFPQLRGYPKNRILLNVENPSKYDYDYNTTSWKYENTYCYELIVPATTREKLNKLMQKDLENYFGLNLSIEKYKVKCLILKSNSDTSKAHTKEGSPENNLEENSILGKQIINQPISTLINLINNLISLPVLDESNFLGKVDIKLPNDLTDIKKLRESLKQYGFDLVEEDREIEMAVIKEMKEKYF